ncbi:MAG: DDE-type integrase/transposase/recombinase [Euryarchaeota archaeon]|nr:DDE-type integrase/transposase/recombinase [Euryarchaeota archaeon]
MGGNDGNVSAWSAIGDIANVMGLNRKTVSKYVKAASPPRYERKERASKLDPFKEHIRARLAENPFTATRMMCELKSMGYDGRLTILKEFMAPIKDMSKVVAEIRFETEPGEQSQVDWVDLGRIQVGDEVLHLYGFVMVLSWSRMRFVHVTTDVRTETFIQCQILAFQYFGGWTKSILYDNTKNVVLKRAIQYVEKDFFLGVEFDNVSHLKSKVADWCQEANGKVHGTTHEVPLQRWHNEGLMPFIDARPYPLTIVTHRRSSRDCFVRYENNFYSLPWRYCGT